jgi:CRISPR-associated protein Cas2
MLVLVTYDVSTESGAGRRWLRRVARVCQNYGQRVQKSVFECVVDPAQWVKLRSDLMAEADGVEDSLRFYFSGE